MKSTAINSTPVRILIVDNDERIRRVIIAMVRDFASVRECNDGSEALTAYQQFLPDWVLMDINMKEIDGLCATKIIKRTFPHARIIIVSKYPEADMRGVAIEAGACDYVGKENLLALCSIINRGK